MEADRHLAYLLYINSAKAAYIEAKQAKCINYLLIESISPNHVSM